MHGRRNYDFLPRRKDGKLTYYVSIRPNAETLGELREGMLSLCETALAAFDHVIPVTTLRVRTRSVQRDETTPLDQALDRVLDGPVSSFTVSNDEGVTGADVRQALADHSETGQALFPINLTPLSCATVVFLNQGFLTLDGSDDDAPFYKMARGTGIIGTTPDVEPMAFVLKHKRNKPFTNPLQTFVDSPRESCETEYRLEVIIQTEHWTTIAPDDPAVDAITRINRARLHEALDTVIQSQDTLEVAYLPSGYLHPVDEDIQRLIAYDGPPADELLADYRRLWVDRHLLPQAVGTARDGHRHVDFGQADELVFPDELKRRIEAYLAADDSGASVDQVTVRTHDGTTLTGTTTDAGVEWQD